MIFRYPGGKAKLLPIIQGYLDTLGFKDGDPFHDVFVGGGSVVLHIAKNYPQSKLHANDLDPWMFAFWKVISGPRKDFDRLVKLVSIEPTVERFVSLRNSETADTVDGAYRAVFFNRTAFSGILRSGPIGGYEQTSAWKVSCRYNADAIRKDLLYMREQLNLADRLVAHRKDAVKYVQETTDFMYLDPPYVGQGKALYRETVDHHKLADVLRPKGRWLLSYDACEETRKLYCQFAHIAAVPARYSIRGKKHTWTGNAEFMITPEAVVTPWQADLV